MFVALWTSTYLRTVAGLNDILSISINLFRFFSVFACTFIEHKKRFEIFSFLVFSPKYWREIKTDLMKDEIIVYVRSF